MPSDGWRPPIVTLNFYATLAAIQRAITILDTKVTKLMTEDATIAAQVAAEEVDIQQLTAAFTSVQAFIATLQAEIAAGASNVSAATLTSLTQLKTDLDAVTATGSADAAADVTPAP
jgi:septal ring factor EnvC (AmiA/AmiB activator)